MAEKKEPKKKKAVKKAVKKAAAVKKPAKKKAAKKKAVKKKAVKKKAVKKKAVKKKVSEKTPDALPVKTPEKTVKKKKTAAKKKISGENTSGKKPETEEKIISKTTLPAEPAAKAVKPKKTAKPKKKAPAKKIPADTGAGSADYKEKLQTTEEEDAVKASKYSTPISRSLPPEMNEGELPERYYDNKLVFMARDPYWCYAYWDISEELLKEKASAMNPEWGSYRLCLRVYEADEEGRPGEKYSDVMIPEDTGNWYVNIWEAAKSYVADIGYKAQDGHFAAITRSNPVITPPDRVSGDDIEDESEMTGAQDEDFDEIFQMSGGGGSKPGASEKAGMGEYLSSGALSSVSSPGGPLQPAGKDFWLKADTELILYGATEPDAELTVQGEKIDLEKDGSFSLRFYLPDGTLKLPVKAVSNGGGDVITIEFKVERSSSK
ncbi:MAG: DUF4912 domain-containing protein [Candidatus Goldiibacteriota bacterium]